MPKVNKRPKVGNKVIAPNQQQTPEYHPQDLTRADKPNQDFKKPNAKPPKARKVKID